MTNPIQNTLNERQWTHGNYADQAILTCTIIDSFRCGANWQKLGSAQEYALIMIAGKIGRILTGNPDYPDHWHDIAGYSTLVEQSLQHKAGAEAADAERGVRVNYLINPEDTNQ